MKALIVMIIVLLAACGSSGSSKPNTPPTEAITATPAAGVMVESFTQAAKLIPPTGSAIVGTVTLDALAINFELDGAALYDIQRNEITNVSVSTKKSTYAYATIETAKTNIMISLLNPDGSTDIAHTLALKSVLVGGIVQ